MNLYVMQDRVSGSFGNLFEAVNDESVIRDFKNLICNPNIPDYVVYDTVVLHLGSFNQDMKNPAIVPAVIPTVVFRGDELEFRKIREKIVSENSPDPVQ